MKTNNETKATVEANDFLTCDINNIGKPANGGGSKKSAIEADIYEAVIIGVCDAGKSEYEWQGKTKIQQNAVIVIQLDHINGFGTQSVVTTWVKPSGHENSKWTKEFITPTKLKIKSMGDLLGQAIRVEIEIDEKGYPNVTRYFASKKPIEVATGLYIPEWIYKKSYPMVKHNSILNGIRPKSEATVATGATTASTKEVQQEAELADAEKQAGDDLPF